MELYSKLKYRPIDLIINKYKKRNTHELEIFISNELYIRDEFTSLKREPIRQEDLEKLLNHLTIKEIHLEQHKNLDKSMIEFIIKIIRQFQYDIQMIYFNQYTAIIDIIQHIRCESLIIHVDENHFYDLLDICVSKLTKGELHLVSLFNPRINFFTISDEYFDDTEIKIARRTTYVLVLTLRQI